MNRISLPIADILVENRQRFDMGDINTLADSLQRFGLIQPIVINQDKRLIAGGRRLTAAKLLSWQNIDVVFRETMSVEELHELELEENVRRKDLSWQERVLNIATIHELKQRSATLEGRSWGQRETGEMLGESKSNINYALIIARKLREELLPTGGFKEGAKYAACENLFNAWRLRMTEEMDEINAELARRHVEQPTQPAAEVDPFETMLAESGTDLTQTPLANLDYEQAKERYYSNPHNPPDSFDEYYAGYLARKNARENSIHLSGMLIQGDSIAYMHAHPGSFAHIITDIPYAIDIDMLDQQKGIQDIDTVREEHNVDYNLKLIEDFFPAAFTCTKEHAFVVTFCDYWIWRWMADLALKAGFVVQRWPCHWVKPTALNQCANFNYTKSTEAILVCRKPGTTLTSAQTTCCVHTGKDELCEAIDHPFAKPFDAWKFIIEATTLENECILEPFAGRGSGVISMLRLKRHVVGVELQQNHYNYLLENVKKYFLALNPNCLFT